MKKILWKFLRWHEVFWWFMKKWISCSYENYLLDSFGNLFGNYFMTFLQFLCIFFYFYGNFRYCAGDFFENSFGKKMRIFMRISTVLPKKYLKNQSVFSYFFGNFFEIIFWKIASVPFEYFLCKLLWFFFLKLESKFFGNSFAFPFCFLFPFSFLINLYLYSDSTILSAHYLWIPLALPL